MAELNVVYMTPKDLQHIRGKRREDHRVKDGAAIGGFAGGLYGAVLGAVTASRLKKDIFDRGRLSIEARELWIKQGAIDDPIMEKLFKQRSENFKKYTAEVRAQLGEKASPKVVDHIAGWKARGKSGEEIANRLITLIKSGKINLEAANKNISKITKTALGAAKIGVVVTAMALGAAAFGAFGAAIGAFSKYVYPNTRN